VVVRPTLVAWAAEDRVMPPSHGRRLAELMPQARLVEIADSHTLIPEDQPAVLTPTCGSSSTAGRDVSEIRQPPHCCSMAFLSAGVTGSWYLSETCANRTA